MKKLLMMITLCMGALCAHAVETTDITGWQYAVYMETTKAQVGQNVDIYLHERTAMKSGGFSTDIFLPDGITGVTASNCGRFETLIIDSAVALDGSFRVIYTVAVNDIMVPAGTDEEVLKVTLNVGPDVEPGDYPIRLANTEIASETGAAGTMKRPAEVVCILHVQNEPVVDEGFSMTTPAFCVPAGVEYDEADGHTSWLTLTATAQRDVAKVAFDLTLPEGLSIGTYVFKKKEYPDPYYAWDTEYEGDATPDCTDNGDGTYTFEAEYDIPAGTQPWIALPLATDAELTAGVFDVAVSNIVFTQANGHEFHAEDFTASVLCNVEGMKNLDLRTAKGVEGLTIDVAANPNLIIFANDGQVANAQNVVVDGVCENMVLTDKYAFSLAEAVTATNVSYQRADITNYATLYLPFAFNVADADFDAFAYDRVEDGKMVFEPVAASCSAQTPYLIRPKKDAEKAEVALEAHNVEIAATADNSVEADGYSFMGTFTKKVVNGNDGYYAFSATDGAFKRCNTTVGTTVSAFRAYVHADSAPAKIAVVEDDATSGIVEVNADAADKDVYDLLGRRISALTGVNGIVIINGKKVVLK